MATQSTGHKHGTGLVGFLSGLFHLHSHESNTANAYDPAFQTEQGIRTVWYALAALTATTILQIGVVAVSGSVSLLGDTVHNLGDALNSIPLLMALYLARRIPTRRYTFGFGRAEDLSGVIIVLSIAFSAAYILWESVDRLFNPQPMTNVGWVTLAAIIGFIGNEAVAIMQIRAGRRMGSAAMIADGMHARVDGFTSLAVLFAVIGTVLGFPILDPIIGLLIGISIIFITWGASRQVWERLMDAVDPMMVERVEQLTSEVDGVKEITNIQARWLGHQFTAVIRIVVDDGLLQVESQAISDRVREHVTKFLGRSADIVVSIVRPVNTYKPEQAAAESILPPQYRDGRAVSAAPMGAAALVYDDSGDVAWNEVWTGFCELALAGGAPHRGTLLEPVNALSIRTDDPNYKQVLKELERGLKLVTGLPIVESPTPGWIGLQCEDEKMALWLLRAIVVENISVRRENNVLFFPAGPEFRLEREIKNVVTVVAKTTHYWVDHARSLASA